MTVRMMSTGAATEPAGFVAGTESMMNTVIETEAVVESGSVVAGLYMNNHLDFHHSR